MNLLYDASDIKASGSSLRNFFMVPPITLLVYSDKSISAGLSARRNEGNYG